MPFNYLITRYLKLNKLLVQLILFTGEIISKQIYKPFKRWHTYNIFHKVRGFIPK